MHLSIYLPPSHYFLGHIIHCLPVVQVYIHSYLLPRVLPKIPSVHSIAQITPKPGQFYRDRRQNPGVSSSNIKTPSHGIVSALKVAALSHQRATELLLSSSSNMGDFGSVTAASACGRGSAVRSPILDVSTTQPSSSRTVSPISDFSDTQSGGPS